MDVFEPFNQLDCIESLFDRGEYDKADELLRYNRPEAFNWWYSFYSGAVKVNLEEYDEAREIFVNEVLPYLDDCSNDIQYAVYTYLSTCAHSRRDYEAVVNYTQKALDQIKTGKVSTTATESDELFFVAYHELIIGFLNLGKFIDMRGYLDKLKGYCRADTDWVEYYYYESAYYNFTGMYQQALEAARKSLAKLPVEHADYYLMGALLNHISYALAKLKCYNLPKKLLKYVAKNHPETDISGTRRIVPLVNFRKRDHPLEVGLLAELERLQTLQ